MDRCESATANIVHRHHTTDSHRVAVVDIHHGRKNRRRWWQPIVQIAEVSLCQIKRCRVAFIVQARSEIGVNRTRITAPFVPVHHPNLRSKYQRRCNVRRIKIGCQKEVDDVSQQRRTTIVGDDAGRHQFGVRIDLTIVFRGHFQVATDVDLPQARLANQLIIARKLQLSEGRRMNVIRRDNSSGGGTFGTINRRCGRLGRVTDRRIDADHRLGVDREITNDIDRRVVNSGQGFRSGFVASFQRKRLCGTDRRFAQSSTSGGVVGDRGTNGKTRTREDLGNGARRQITLRGQDRVVDRHYSRLSRTEHTAADRCTHVADQ